MPTTPDGITAVDLSKLPPREAAAITYGMRIRSGLAAARKYVRADLDAGEISAETARYIGGFIDRIDRDILKDVGDLAGIELPAGAVATNAFGIPNN